ncbi:hypothetical protein GGR52DRAFT_542770 [Hypoxylon sp. FL1284]|nr:hypothetical protein GGR52DRAFT_542770 [Hypoxylon sp. FL1284]
MRRVAGWLDGAGDATASLLYSDVGDYYVGKGWDTLQRRHCTFYLPGPTPGERPGGLPETRLLTGDDLPELCERDVESLESVFRNAKPHLGTTFVAVLPTFPLVGWLQDRVAFTNAKLFGKVPEAKGTICESADAWMYWYHDLRNGRLVIQRVKPPREMDGTTGCDALVKLLLDSLDEAAKWGLKDVMVWDPSPDLDAAMGFVQIQLNLCIRDNFGGLTELPCLRWRNGKKLNVTVLSNEFYGWS